MWEPLLWLMFGGEAALFYFVWTTRDSQKLQILIFLLVTVICLLIQPLNEWLNKNW
jgi:hypothetical protein